MGVCMSDVDTKAVKDYLLSFQEAFFRALIGEDAEVSVQKDSWERPEGGGGITLALEDGPVIERSGVNFSHVMGENLPPSASAHRPELAGRSFEAMGVSTIVHPRNPFAPTTHANIRLFVATKSGEAPIWWFGGGFDLTPYYGFEEDCIHFHQHAKAACDPYGEDVYPRFKKWADDYFYLKHRQEPRGIGGIFFDDLNEWDFETSFAFLKDVGKHFIEAYIPILNKRKNTPFEQKHRDFQCYRRGRYVEFNLVYDRGTLFGLQSNGRTESILISLPSEVHWKYNWTPEAGSAEAQLYDKFLVPTDWASMEQTTT